MAVTSAGILLYRLTPALEVLIAHMGGPFWAKKDAGAWSIPKGEYDEASETPLDAARREFGEELGIAAPDLGYAELGTFAYSSGKLVTVFVTEAADFDPTGARFGTFDMEWPPRSGKTASFPEVDRVEWIPADAAVDLVVKGQRPAITALEKSLDAASG